MVVRRRRLGRQCGLGIGEGHGRPIQRAAVGVLEKLGVYVDNIDGVDARACTEYFTSGAWQAAPPGGGDRDRA